MWLAPYLWLHIVDWSKSCSKGSTESPLWGLEPQDLPNKWSVPVKLFISSLLRISHLVHLSTPYGSPVRRAQVTCPCMVPTPGKRLPLMCERVSAAGRTLWPVEPVTANVHPSQSPDKLAHGHGGKAGHLLNYFFWFFFLDQSVATQSQPAFYLFLYVYLCIFCIDCWGWLSYLSLLFFGTLHSNGNIFPFLLCFSLLFFSQLFVRPPQTAILLFLYFFSMGMVFIPVSCTMSWTSIHSP